MCSLGVKYTITNDLEAVLPMADVLYVNRVEEDRVNK
jgi:hypothetical protein